MLLGIVTATHESYSIIDSINEVNDDGSRYREESRKVISYQDGRRRVSGSPRL